MDILQNNPYRILGVYSNSTAKERLANLNRMKAFLKVGKAVSFPLDLREFLGPIMRNERVVTDAETKLALPKDQVPYAQFWFLKSTPTDEIAFNYLFSGNFEKAIEIWNRKEDVSSLQNLFVCHLIKNNLFLAVYYAEQLYENEENFKSLISFLIPNFSQMDKQCLIANILDNLCDEFGTKEVLYTNVAPSIPLLDFARAYGQTKLVGFVNQETGEPFKAIAFVKGDKNTLVSFGTRLGELTSKEIINCKRLLEVVSLPRGHYRLIPKDFVRGEWRKYIVEKQTSKILADIQNAIDEAKKSNEGLPRERLKAGENLRNEAEELLTQLSAFLSQSDVLYQMNSDKLGLEILQCGIDYYNASDDSDAALKAMVLQKYALGIVVGQAAKNRCQENVDILQKIIDNLPPSEVAAEDRFIKEELHKYCQLPDLICHAMTLLKNTQPYLKSIKRKMGDTNAYYLKMSNLLVGNALHNVIEEVNEAQKYDPAEERRKRRKMDEKDNPLGQLTQHIWDYSEYMFEQSDRKEKFERIKSAVLKAREALLLMDSMDMEKEFEQKRYLENRNTLNGMLVQLGENPLPKYKPVSLRKKVEMQVEGSIEKMKHAKTDDVFKYIVNAMIKSAGCVKENLGCAMSIVFVLAFTIVGAVIAGFKGAIAGLFISLGILSKL